MKKIKLLSCVSALASFMIMIFLGTLYSAAESTQHEGVEQNGREITVVNNKVITDGHQFQLAPRRLKDKPDNGMELESDTRPVSIQRYKLSDKGSINIFILNTGDIHASSGKHKKIVNFIKDMKRDHPGKVILLDAGDMLTKTHGLTPDDEKARDWRGKGQTERMFGWASSLPYDAMVFGNHDFIESASVTQQKMHKYSLPFICANLEHPDRHPGYREDRRDRPG